MLEMTAEGSVPVFVYIYRSLLCLFGFLSLVLYFRVIWVIATERRRNPLFRNFFFKIFLTEVSIYFRNLDFLIII